MLRKAPKWRLWLTMSIRHKLLVGFGIITFVLLLTVTVSLLALQNIRQFHYRIIREDIPTVMNNHIISRDVYASLSALHGWINTGHNSYQAERQALWSHVNKTTKENDVLVKQWKNTTDQMVWHRTKIYLQQLKAIQEAIVSVERQKKKKVTSLFLLSHPVVYWNDMSKFLTRMMDIEQQEHKGKRSPVSQLLLLIQRHEQQSLMSFQKYLMTNAAGDLGNYKKYSKQASNDIVRLQNLLALLSFKHGSLSKSFLLSQQILLRRFFLMHQQFNEVVQRLSQLRSAVRWSPSAYLLVAQAEPVVSRIMDLLIGERNNLRQRLGGLKSNRYLFLVSATHKLSSDITRLQWFEWSMLVLGIMLSLLITFLITKVILRPLNRAITISEAIAHGQRDINVRVQSTDDEAGKLLNALSYMQSAIQKAERKLELRKEEMRHLAFHDALTKLPNRAYFQNELERLLVLAERHDQRLGLLLLDFDNFKSVNDSLGHDIGDLLLASVAERLKELFRKEDFISRMGGDEFAVLLYGIEGDHVVAKVADKILYALKEPFLLDTYKINITLSIGIACYPTAGVNGSNLIKAADIAMYWAKKKGRNGYEFYNAIESSKYKKRTAIENNLGFSIENQELHLVYQPVFNMSSKKITGVEALVRWHHPELGVLMPDEFIHIAENIGFINTLDKWVFQTAAQQLAHWRRHHIMIDSMFINIASFAWDYSEIITKVIEQLKIPTDSITFEVTERVLMEEYQGFSELLAYLHDAGIGIAIDDFGTGYSSLSRLREFPVKALKIDRSFVSTIGMERSGEVIVKSIIALGNSLALDVIAEGVETKGQHEFLLNNGCPYGQGFYYSKPLSQDKLAAFFQAHNEPKE